MTEEIVVDLRDPESENWLHSKKRRTKMRTRQEIMYPDDTGYDAVGYSLSTRMHKRKGVRRYFRPL